MDEFGSVWMYYEYESAGVRKSSIEMSYEWSASMDAQRWGSADDIIFFFAELGV